MSQNHPEPADGEIADPGIEDKDPEELIEELAEVDAVEAPQIAGAIAARLEDELETLSSIRRQASSSDDEAEEE